MSQRARKVVQAWLDAPNSGVIELVRDWRLREKPDLRLSGGLTFTGLERVSDLVHGRDYGYFVAAPGRVFFVVSVAAHPEIDPLAERLYLAGDFNGWADAAGRDEWELFPATVSGELMMVWSGASETFLNSHGLRFKFVTRDRRWLPVPATAPNAIRDESGNTNYFFDPERTGHHMYRFTLGAPLDLSRVWSVEWEKPSGEGAPLRPDGFFFRMKSDLPLGATVRPHETVFRLFAPRASRVELCVAESPDPRAVPHRYSLIRRAEPVEHMREAMHALRGEGGRKPEPAAWQGVWEVTLDRNLEGWFYWYHVDGPGGPYGHFDPEHRILDPYALASVGREGPGIVVDRARHARSERTFKTPDWQNLVIAEAHVRDLARHAPSQAAEAERLGFEGLRKWVESPDFYLHRLGVNCVELQPVHENDALTREEYAWGYMPVSWFAPASTYSRDPASASGIREFQDLVAAFHRRGMAVILDVVFNHQGVPAHLMYLDKHYYFEVGNDGSLSNWSGCGNDLRARSAMARRLIIDSCLHFIETYGVDGFRFDLAELLGTDVLREIERALKLVKRDVILVAEPWSFRGHIAGELAETGWSSWNDGYRNFLRDYVRGGGSPEQAEYFLKGSPWYYARWPAQTVNYTESHDDRTWIDVITENGDGSGHYPTANDRRRTHLMAAILFASLGIPMISAGQDFLRSKHGVNNTYLRGDLNALDYRRLQRYSGTHAYFASWITFRLGEHGRLLRQWSMPSEGYFRRFGAPNSPAIALLYNADGSQGLDRLLFAVNPAQTDVEIALDADVTRRLWRQVADHERFDLHGVRGMAQPVGEKLFVPALGCGLWISGV